MEQALKLSKIKVPQGRVAVYFSVAIELCIQLFHTFHTLFQKEISPSDYKIRLHNKIIILRVLNRLYKWYYFKNVNKSLYCHLKSLNLAERLGPSSELIYCYMLGGVIWASFPWKFASLRYAHLGVNTAIMTGDRIQEGTACAGFSLALLMLNKPSEGLEYSKRSIRLLKGLGEYWDLGVAYAFRVQNGLLTGRLRESLAVSEEFISLSSETKILQNLGWALIRKGQSSFLIGEVTDSTIADVKKAYDLMEKTRDNANLLGSLSTLASLYLRKKYVDAIRTIEQVVRLFPTHYSNGAWTLELFPLGAQIYLDSIRQSPTLLGKEEKSF